MGGICWRSWYPSVGGCYKDLSQSFRLSLQPLKYVSDVVKSGTWVGSVRTPGPRVQVRDQSVGNGWNQRMSHLCSILKAYPQWRSSKTLTSKFPSARVEVLKAQ